MKLWWLALLLAVVLLVFAVWRYRTSSQRLPRVSGPVLAHFERVRALPRFQARARKWRRWVRFELLFLVLALTGALLMISRPMTISDDSKEMRSRDVMLCLDVSGSMTNADQTVLRSYLRLVDQLKGERIGLVVWDSAGSLAFPLTDDYVFIREQLESMLVALGDSRSGSTALDGSAILRAARVGGGSSLIGDGAMSCLLRFDQHKAKRPRTVVLATDNQLAGTPIFTFDEAGKKALRDRVLIMGISPGLSEGPEKEEFQSIVERTGGQLLEITDDPLIEDRITQAITRQQRQAIMAVPSARSFDVVWPGALVLAVGLAGLTVTTKRAQA